MVCIINYIIKYQNNHISGFMLKNVVPTLIERGLPVKPLFDSAVFRYTFEVDEWPTNHHNDAEELRPFNENIFLLNKFYM